MAKLPPYFNGPAKGETDSDFYATFDSGDGPTVPSNQSDSFAHQDSGKGLSSYTMNEIDMVTVHGGVPEVKSTTR